MTIRRMLLGTLGVAVIGVGAMGLRAAPGRQREPKGEEVTLTGRLVDLQSFMTAKHPAGNPSKASQEAIRAGVPVALETDEGVIVVGMGERGPARITAPFALQQVELKGRLYEKEGMQYLDLTSVRAAKEEKVEHDDAEHVEEEHPEEEPTEEEP